jgi:hypothetical protein
MTPTQYIDRIHGLPARERNSAIRVLDRAVKMLPLLPGKPGLEKMRDPHLRNLLSQLDDVTLPAGGFGLRDVRAEVPQ